MENFVSPEQVAERVMEIARRFNLKVSSQDTTLHTYKARVEISRESFVQIYYNTRKNKFLLALVKHNKRLFGFDKLDEKCHEHPEKEPEKHIEKPCSEMNLEKFILKAIKLVKEQSHG